MSDLTRRTLLIGAAALAPIVIPLAPDASADPRLAATSLATNVRDHGAVGNGTTDDTGAIESAFVAAGPSGALFFPPGNYLYSGPGLDSAYSPAILGAASSSTTISLGPTSYFINYRGLLQSLLVRDISFVGGKGAIKHSFTGINVAGHHLVQSCRFKGYTECAIATESPDMPYWHIRDCVFDSANTTTTIGVALGRGTDQCVIDSCSFIRNRVHIKARRGNNFHITRTDMLQFSKENSGGPRMAIWITPDTTTVNPGNGLTVTGCKFGNENLTAGDFFILYADERAGASNGAMFPDLASDSPNFVSGHMIMQNAFFGIGSASPPIIYSTTPNVRSLQVCNNVVGGGQPSYVIQFKTLPSRPDRLASNSIFGPFTGQVSTETLPFADSNATGVGYWQDPQGLQQRANTVRNWAGGASASFRELLSEPINAFTTVAATATPFADAYGGTDAAKFVMGSSSSVLYSTLKREFTRGMPVWVEFDVANPADGNSAGQFFVWLSDSQTVFHWRRCIEVPAPDMGWVTYAFCFTPRTVDQGPARIVFAVSGTSEVGKSIRLGRPRVYQANERQLGGARPTVAAPAENEREAVLLVNDLRLKLIQLGLVSGVPTDGPRGV